MLTLRFNATILLHFKSPKIPYLVWWWSPKIRYACIYTHVVSYIYVNAKRRPEHAHFLLSDKINLDYNNPIFLQFS